jgi:hypothetical protein
VHSSEVEHFPGCHCGRSQWDLHHAPMQVFYAQAAAAYPPNMSIHPGLAQVADGTLQGFQSQYILQPQYIPQHYHLDQAYLVGSADVAGPSQNDTPYYPNSDGGLYVPPQPVNELSYGVPDRSLFTAARQEAEHGPVQHELNGVIPPASSQQSTGQPSSEASSQTSSSGDSQGREHPFPNADNIGLWRPILATNPVVGGDDDSDPLDELPRQLGDLLEESELATEELQWTWGVEVKDRVKSIWD